MTVRETVAAFCELILAGWGLWRLGCWLDGRDARMDAEFAANRERALDEREGAEWDTTQRAAAAGPVGARDRPDTSVTRSSSAPYDWAETDWAA